MGDVDAQLPAAVLDLPGVQVLPEGGDELDLHPKQRQIVGDVAPDAAERHPHQPGIGIPGNQRLGRDPGNVDVDAADHHHIWIHLQNVTLALDDALLHQIGDVHRHRGPGDTRLIGQFLLRDQRVFRDPAKELPFPFCNHKHL